MTPDKLPKLPKRDDRFKEKCFTNIARATKSDRHCQFVPTTYGQARCRSLVSYAAATPTPPPAADACFSVPDSDRCWLDIVKRTGDGTRCRYVTNSFMLKACETIAAR